MEWFGLPPDDIDGRSEREGGGEVDSAAAFAHSIGSFDWKLQMPVNSIVEVCVCHAGRFNSSNPSIGALGPSATPRAAHGPRSWMHPPVARDGMHRT